MITHEGVEPGGYLQWDEFDPTILRAVPRVDDLPMNCLCAMAEIFNTTKPIR